MMNKRNIELLIFCFPLVCFVLLLISFLGPSTEAIKNIGWVGSIAGIPVGIISKVRNTSNGLAIANISVGIFSVLLMIFLIGIAVAFFLLMGKGAEEFVNFIDAVKVIG